MAVKPSDLENRAETSESIKGSDAAQADLARVKGRQPEPEPCARCAEIAQRVAAARELRSPRGIEHPPSWGMGRDSAIHAIAPQ